MESEGESMFDSGERTIYYVSNVGEGSVSIIDGNNNQLIKEIQIGSRPQNIIVDEKDNVYIANDRNNQIMIIYDLYDSEKTWDIPNNGNLQVDSIAQKIYISNTEQICVYSLKTGKKIHCLTGFAAADRLELDGEKRRLFILDILRREIKIYETEKLQLINVLKGVGYAPCDILLGTDEKYLYIANKGSERDRYTGNISIVNIETGKISYIEMKKGSVITSLEQSGTHVYAANSGLHQIEVIDIQNKQCISMIKTTLPIIQRLRLSPDKKTLLAISRSNEGKSVIDKIDTTSHIIVDRFTFKENDSYPYDIRVVSQKEPQIEEEYFVLKNSEDQCKKEKGITILAKEVVSVYQEKMVFTEISIGISSKVEKIVNIGEIIFQKCKMVKETMSRKNLPNRTDYSTLQYDFYIPYDIEAKDRQEQVYMASGKIEGSQKATLYIPAHAEQKGLQFESTAFAKLTSSPVIVNNNLTFDVSVLISTKVIIDKIVFVPFCKACKEWQERGERKEEE